MAPAGQPWFTIPDFLARVCGTHSGAASLYPLHACNGRPSGQRKDELPGENIHEENNTRTPSESHLLLISIMIFGKIRHWTHFFTLERRKNRLPLFTPHPDPLQNNANKISLGNIPSFIVHTILMVSPRRPASKQPKGPSARHAL